MTQGRWQIQEARAAVALVVGTLALLAAALLFQSLNAGSPRPFFQDAPAGAPAHITWTSGESVSL